MKNNVISWLKLNDIYYDKLIFSPEDKLDICINHNIDIMIEDSPNNINTLSTKIPVICFNANYNSKCKGDNILRCYSWYDIYNKILNMK
ncbi:5' nucleotidase, deoxy (Pyrimidine), cytosolic type C protein (NT5C) [compost metagenome]